MEPAHSYMGEQTHNVEGMEAFFGGDYSQGAIALATRTNPAIPSLAFPLRPSRAHSHTPSRVPST